jgi:threonine dehydrogenase-like Zn-dependent dehydrogenase
MLLKLAANGKLPLHKLITHSMFDRSSSHLDISLTTVSDYKFADIQEAYGTFKAAAENRALKMLIELE